MSSDKNSPISGFLFDFMAEGRPPRHFLLPLLAFMRRDSAFIPTQGTGRSGILSRRSAIAVSDLKLLVKKAFDRGFIDSHILGFEHFEEDLRRGIEHPGEPRLPDDRDSTLFGDTVEELSGW